jgi:hypothetical protein
MKTKGNLSTKKRTSTLIEGLATILSILWFQQEPLSENQRYSRIERQPVLVYSQGVRLENNLGDEHGGLKRSGIGSRRIKGPASLLC